MPQRPARKTAAKAPAKAPAKTGQSEAPVDAADITGPSAAALVAREVGSACRGDFNDLDGGWLEVVFGDFAAVMDATSPHANRSLTQWRADLGICPAGHGHWTRSCTPEECGHEPTRW